MRRVILGVVIAMLAHVSVATAQEKGLGYQDRIPLESVDRPALSVERSGGAAAPPIPVCAPAPNCLALSVATCTSKAVCHRSPGDRPDIACLSYVCTPTNKANAPIILKQPDGMAATLKHSVQ